MTESYDDYQARRERRRAQTAHRRPPLPASMIAVPVPGICRWCARPSDTPRRTWHDACVVEYRIACGQLSLAVPDLIARDGERCAGCGDPPSKIPPRGFRFTGEVVDSYVEDWQEWRRQGLAPPRFSRVAPLALLEVDHRIPLWKAVETVSHDVLWHWKLPNLQLLCWCCHARKTKAEAAERAHHRRLRPRANSRAPLPF